MFQNIFASKRCIYFVQSIRYQIFVNLEFDDQNRKVLQEEETKVLDVLRQNVGPYRNFQIRLAFYDKDRKVLLDVEGGVFCSSSKCWTVCKSFRSDWHFYGKYHKVLLEVES